MISKRRFLTSLVGTGVAALAGGIGARPDQARAKHDGEGIEGSWMSDVTTGSDQRRSNLLTFAPDGSLAMTGSEHLTRGPGHGRWVRIGDREFLTTTWALRFDRDGNYIGKIRTRSLFTLNEAGDQYSARTLVDFFDVQGNPERSNTATSQGIRFEVEPLD